MKQQRRQAMSNILATVLLIGIAVGVASIVLVMSTDLVKTQLSSDSIDIISAKISNTDTDSWLTVSIKNTGNSELEDLTVEVKGLEFGADESDSDRSSTISFDPDTLRPGKGLSLTEKLTVLVSEGTSVLVVISGDTTSGGTVSETLTIKP